MSSQSQPYRELAPAPPEPRAPDYAPHWAAARWRWVAFFAVWLGAMPLFLAIDVIGEKWTGRRDWSFPPILSVLYSIPFFVTAIRAASLRCPRCRRSFGSKGSFHNPFVRRCVNCGLPYRAKTDPDWRSPEREGR